MYAGDYSLYRTLIGAGGSEADSSVSSGACVFSLYQAVAERLGAQAPEATLTYQLA